MQRYTLHRPVAEADRPAVARAVAESFGFSHESAETWFTHGGWENVVALEAEGAIIGGLLEAPHGQFFGGRAVPAMGFAGVGILPEWRRQGAAVAMMTEDLRRLRATGVALANLYASTHALYARVGFGDAGNHHIGTVTPAGIRVGPAPGLTTRRLGEADRPAMKALYTARAARRTGHLDRGHYVWFRVFRAWEGREAHCTGVFDGDRLAGYIVWRRAAPYPPCDVTIIDVVAPTPAVTRRLWQFLADQGTMVDTFHLATAPHDPFWLALPHPGPKLVTKSPWMLRLVDLPAAIAARGYPAHVSVRVGLAVEDATLPENAGAWTLVVEGGRGRLERGGDVETTVTIEGLAALYTGFQDAATVEARGLFTGDAGAAERLDRAFGGPVPWMSDMF
ncbi:MAG: GNAT family N-acetyltransferase [Myxococcales bacterium]|nr:GNAT family N-acetyltransferase [Myxococcales bacterium]